MPIRVQTPDGVTEFPDGTTPEEIDQILGAAPPDDAPERTWTDTAVDALPFIGGAIGGIVGAPTGPGAIGAAALGAAGGEGWRQVINRVRGKGGPGTMTEAAGDIATEGAAQGAGQAVGMGVGKLASKGGQAIYRGLLKAPERVTDKFGDVVPGMMKRGRLITEGGAKKAKAALVSSRQAADDIIENASDAAPYITPDDATKYFGDVKKTVNLRALGGQADESGEIARRAAALKSNMTAETGVGLDLRKANALKREMDKAADGAQRAMQRGATGQLSTDSMLDDAVRRGLKDRIDEVSGVGPQNALTRQLMGESMALRAATRRNGKNLAVGGARDLIAAGVGAGVGSASGGGTEGAAGGAVTAGLLMRLLSSPRGGSMAAIGMDRAGKAAPDVLRALAALMSSHGEQ